MMSTLQSLKSYVCFGYSLEGLREDKFEPLVSPYDFLTLIEASKKEKVAHRLGRLPLDHHHLTEEDEFGDEHGEQRIQEAHMNKHHHTEL